ncbi:DUF2254 family protein [Nocardioides sp. MH1]|uniref:DUF2254 family protein n=1 Tax=Nocardioides sp. MH1 TaxID=3242490 RepID=UPI0035229D93
MNGAASASTPLRVRVPRALREFAAVPVGVVLGLLVLAGVSIAGDQAHGHAVTALREWLGHFIGKQSATDTLGAVAGGLVTVTSITFSVLLLAVQQTASNLSPVVFDQFVRRRANQLYLGLFVGLALYSYVVLAAVQPSTPPIIGAFLATVLTVVALACLLFLVYSTIDQMRPDNVMRQLHDRAVAAHQRESRIIAATRRGSISSAPVAAEVRSQTYGYVESVDLERVVAALGTRTDAEVELHLTIGAPVVFDELLASVRHHDSVEAEAIRAQTARAITLSKSPDIDLDPSAAIRDISNIGWTSGSTSKQNPAIAAQALHALRDLAARWIEEDRIGSNPHPVVYPDDDLPTVIDGLYSAMVVAHESHQHQQAARVLQAYESLLERAQGAVRERLVSDLDVMAPLLAQLPPAPALDRARRAVEIRRVVSPAELQQ